VTGGWRLEPRPVTPEDQPYLDAFHVGEQNWWEPPVTNFLRGEVWPARQVGYRTTLFSLAGRPEIVGFACVGASQLELTHRVRRLFVIDRNVVYDSVPAVHLYIGGVRHDLHDQGFGTEIYAQILESIDASLFGPRFIWLEVWDDSPASGLYKRWGFDELRRATETGPDGKPRHMVTLVHDRYRRIEGA
jgi:ribosomal protein S18 acetylase RimI-like enzyme